MEGDWDNIDVGYRASSFIIDFLSIFCLMANNKLHIIYAFAKCTLDNSIPPHLECSTDYQQHHHQPHHHRPRQNQFRSGHEEDGSKRRIRKVSAIPDQGWKKFM